MEQKKLGEKIKSLRKERGMSQNALAELIDVSFQQVQKYENGQSNINVDRLHKIAAAFNIPVTELFAGEQGKEYKTNPSGITTLTEDEKELMTLFRRIKSDTLKNDLLKHLRNIIEIESKSDTPNS